jgi:hypothetical protein
MFKSTRAKGKARGVSVPTTSGQLPSSIELWCLLEGQSRAFEVPIPANSNVGNLKEAIKAKKQNDLKSYDADTLTLFKVGRSRSSSLFEADRLTFATLSQVNIDLNAHTEDSLRRLDIKEDDEGVQKLIQWKPVSNYWPTQPANDMLQIFVRSPAGEWFHRSWLLTVLMVSSQ